MAGKNNMGLKKETGFTKEDSLVIKGVAILIMMWHHCFLAGRFDGYTISFSPFTVEQVTTFAGFAKICVSFFAFITGYGLYQSYIKSRQSGEPASKWIRVRYLKSFAPFWFVVLLCWIVCFLLNRLPAKVYFENGKMSGLFYMMLDFSGLSSLFGTPSLIASWWYMSACFVFIVFTPVIVAVLDKCGILLFVSCLGIIPRLLGGYPGGLSALTFIPALVMGILFSRCCIFERVLQYSGGTLLKECGIIAALILLTAVSFLSAIKLPIQKFWDIVYGLFPSIYILTIHMTISRLPGVRQVLMYLGKHSANIYMVHNFLRVYYLKDYIYTRGHFLLIILVLLVISLVLSILIEGLKRLFHFSSITDLLQNKTT